jgi:uncharacterized membrane protein
MLLTPTEAAAIEARVAKLEAERGLEVVTLIARKSDDYPEAVWKAFAFGAAAAGLIVALADLADPAWTGASQVLTPVLAVLGAAAACALTAVFVPAVTRLFLHEGHDRMFQISSNRCCVASPAAAREGPSRRAMPLAGPRPCG